MNKKKEENISESDSTEVTQEESDSTEVTQEESDSTEVTQEESTQELLDESKDYEKLHDDYLRLAAEFENYKKRIVKDQENIAISTVSMFALNLLPVVDSFNNALSQDPDSKNLKALYAQLLQSLEAIEIIEVPGVGSPFDPSFHEAIEHTGEGINEQVIEVLRKGFIFRDKLIRPALVKVNSE